MSDQKITSEVRAALQIRTAVDQLMRPGRSGGLLVDVVNPVADIMDAAKMLPSAKLQEVKDHLCEAYPLGGGHDRDVAESDDGPDDPRSPGGDEDPRVEADALREKVRQS